eukprot:1683995-Rhodomonas_salina.2
MMISNHVSPIDSRRGVVWAHLLRERPPAPRAARGAVLARVRPGDAPDRDVILRERSPHAALAHRMLMLSLQESHDRDAGLVGVQYVAGEFASFADLETAMLTLIRVLTGDKCLPRAPLLCERHSTSMPCFDQHRHVSIRNRTYRVGTASLNILACFVCWWGRDGPVGADRGGGRRLPTRSRRAPARSNRAAQVEPGDGAQRARAAAERSARAPPRLRVVRGAQPTGLFSYCFTCIGSV